MGGNAFILGIFLISTLNCVFPSPAKDGCICGIKNDETRIVNGEDAGMNEFPHRCNFQRADGAFCGCSIIGSRWALTAAHCTNTRETLSNPNASSIDVGDHDLSRRDETPNQRVGVEQIFQFPGYNPDNQHNDLSLLKLDRDLVFDRSVSPICLPWGFEKKSFEGINVMASGWGLTEESGQMSMVLQKVELPLLSRAECSEFYPGRISPSMICTYSPGKDTCQGDSGGSIDFFDKESEKYIALGIVSWGMGCAREKKPGVYTKITEFLDWINETTKDDKSICRK